ncbi:MAG: hypothetical protein GX892_08245 [Thermoanaerobacteraceae bacterium]|nr:hypothetical protein [Thermoanaerobacteraceae bacterium]
MGWQCENCLNMNSYRNKSCKICQSRISQAEIKKIISEEIRLQQKKIITLPLKSWLLLVKCLDYCIEKRKYINIAAGLVLIAAIVANFALLKEFNMSNVWEKSRVEHKRYIVQNTKHKNIRYEFNKAVSKALETLKTDKQMAIMDNLHRALKDKEIRDIHIKKADPIKIRVLEEKLWKAIYKIQPLL